MSELNILELALNVLFTWAIGMTPPVAIRMIHRQAISKWYAVAICLVLGFLNIIIFIALGSESTTHAAVFVMGFVSYWILRKERFYNDNLILDELSDKGDASTGSEMTENEPNNCPSCNQKFVSRLSQMPTGLNFGEELHYICSNCLEDYRTFETDEEKRKEIKEE